MPIDKVYATNRPIAGAGNANIEISTRLCVNAPFCSQRAYALGRSSTNRCRLTFGCHFARCNERFLGSGRRFNLIPHWSLDGPWVKDYLMVHDIMSAKY